MHREILVNDFQAEVSADGLPRIMSTDRRKLTEANREHLYRRHYKIHCQRCKKLFRNDRALDEHEMSFVGCEVLSRHSPCDMTTHQHKQLRMKKHTSRRQTDEEKWTDIYRLLFPNEQVPSPCKSSDGLAGDVMGGGRLAERGQIRSPPTT